MMAHFERLGRLGRVILFDQRGTGLSDRVPVDRLPTLETRIDQIPFALPWFLLPIATSDHVRNTWVEACFGLLNSLLIFWLIARRPTRSAPTRFTPPQ